MVKAVGVEFFCYHRDRPGSSSLREELLEQHWSYMDRYQAQMIARGPTLAGDGDTPAGSVHILGLPDPATARALRAKFTGARNTLLSISATARASPPIWRFGLARLGEYGSAPHWMIGGRRPQRSGLTSAATAEPPGGSGPRPRSR